MERKTEVESLFPDVPSSLIFPPRMLFPPCNLTPLLPDGITVVAHCKHRSVPTRAAARML